MKAFIKQEPTLRLQPGQPLTANDAVNVTAVMPGINRPLDNFVIRSPLTVRYPLELLPPAYLRTVSIGDEFTIQWTVSTGLVLLLIYQAHPALYQIRNISRKPYGLNSNPSRLCGTRLRQAGSFEFKPPVENDESFQYAQLIEPGGETTFYQVFCVSDSAEPFSRGSMHLEMLLGEPGSDASLFSPSPSPISSVRLIARFDLNIQMSPAYKYDPEASFLLLVNTDTPGSLIREITGYIRAMLHLKVDVYNLSVSGTLVDKRTDENILTRYAGRTIIILCNSTDYFGQPGRVAYEFIDPWLVSRLLKAKTSILFLGLTNVSHVTDYWGRMVATPELPIDPSGADGSMHVQGIDVLLAGFQNSMKLTNEPGLELTRHTVSIKKPVFQSFKTSSSRSGKKLAKRLSKRYPFRSYTLTADCTNASKTNPAKLIVREGVSSDIAILASSTSCKQEFSHLPASFEYLIAAALPFEKRLQMLWTGSTNPEYLGSGAKHDEAADKQDSAKSVSAVQLPEKVSDMLAFALAIQGVERQLLTLVSSQVHRHIALSIQYNALREVASFCFKAPLRDPSSKLDINILLPLLSKFFSTARASLIGFNKIPDNTKQWLISTMGWLEAETGPKLFGGAWSRKRLVKDFIKINITNAPFQGLEAELKQRRPQFKKSIKDLRKNIKKRKDTQESLVLTATKTEIAQAVGVTDTLFHDIGQQITKSSPTSFWSEDNHAKALNTHLVFAQRIDADEARSKHMLQAMIVSNTAQNQGGGVAEINKGQ